MKILSTLFTFKFLITSNKAEAANLGYTKCGMIICIANKRTGSYNFLQYKCTLYQDSIYMHLFNGWISHLII